MVVDGRKGGQPPRYEVYLRDTRDELIEAITEAENAEWHHQPEVDDRWQMYNRLLGWYEAIRFRIVWWNAVQSDSSSEEGPKRLIPEPRPTSGNALEGHGGEPDAGNDSGI